MKTPECLLRYADRLERYYAKHYPALAPLAKPCFLSTIQTTVEPLPGGETFVITGDIPAMWLRDSSAQVKNYLPFAKEDAEVRALLRGVIAAQAKDVLLDAYANAFNREANGRGFQDKIERNPAVWERKYEADSLCAPILLAETYEQATGDGAIFTDAFHAMLRRIAEVFRLEQHHAQSKYSFERENCPESDTLSGGGLGTPVGDTGMTWSGFRPSDDRCIYHYLIPANMMAVVAMNAAAKMAETRYGDATLAAECKALADEIDAGIRQYGVSEREGLGAIYCYETDGLGARLFMDDANSPSLLAAPYFGYCDRSDPMYQRTRQFVLSEQNPYFVKGSCAEGVGSPHTPEGYVWHIGITMQALTSTDREEILRCLHWLATTHNGCNLMHESFDPNDPARFTRAEFAWANTLLASLMISLMDEDFFEE